MKWVSVLLILLALSSCSLAPKYHRPRIAIPFSYKEELVKWKQVSTQNLALAPRPWWEMYNDNILSQLEGQVIVANQNIHLAFARYQAARAELNVARAAYYPSVLGVANSYRQQLSNNEANKPPTHIYSDNLLSLNLQYEIDVWGRVRNSVAAARSTAQASAADLAAIALSMQAQLASAYFTLRGDDAAQQVLNETVIAYQKALDLTRRRYQGGATSVIDVDQAQTQLEAAKTAAADMHLRRMQLEHAIAILIGRVPATFSLRPRHYRPKLVTVAPNLPSSLLQHRPDIVAAELLVRAANYNIGVACAAFYPAFNFSAGLGVESDTLSNLLSSPSVVWSLGPTAASALLNNGSLPFITQTIFDGGRIRALSQLAWAKYEETAASYKQTVLTAYQEVEDNLIGLHQLDKEYQSQSAATLAAHKALNQAMYRYKDGLTTYLEVVIAQNTFLQTKLSNINIGTRRQVQSVQLIKALGGGWQACCKA